MAAESPQEPDQEQVTIQPGYTFDQKIVDLLQPTLHQVFLEYGDHVRSIGVFFDYYGSLNDADINKGIWIGPQGAVTTPDGVIGSLMNCTRLLENILQRADNLSVTYRDKLTVLVNEINQRSAEYEESQQAEKEEAAQKERDSGSNA